MVVSFVGLTLNTKWADANKNFCISPLGWSNLYSILNNPHNFSIQSFLSFIIPQ